jgi:hypothetical protein
MRSWLQNGRVGRPSRVIHRRPQLLFDLDEMNGYFDLRSLDGRRLLAVAAAAGKA